MDEATLAIDRLRLVKVLLRSWLHPDARVDEDTDDVHREVYQDHEEGKHHPCIASISSRYQAGWRGALHLLAGEPDAIFFASDILALGGIDALRKESHEALPETTRLGRGALKPAETAAGSISSKSYARRRGRQRAFHRRRFHCEIGTRLPLLGIRHPGQATEQLRCFQALRGSIGCRWPRATRDFEVTNAGGPPRDLMAQTMAAENLRVQRDYPAFASAYDALVGRLVSAGAGADAPDVGDTLPPFLLPDENGRLLGLRNFGDARSIVISLNRGHWCTYCRVEFESLQSITDKILGNGGVILAVTPDRQPFARRLKQECRLTYPVLSDIDNAYAMSLGLVVWCGDEVRDLYKSIDWNLDDFQGNDGWMVPIPATYVVAPDGRVKARFVEPDFRRRMELADILDAVDAD